MALKEVDKFFSTSGFHWQLCPYLTKKVKLTCWRDRAYGLEIFCAPGIFCEGNVFSISTRIRGVGEERKSARAPC